MKINMTKPVQVEAKTISLHMKVCDRFSCRLLDQDGASLRDYEGYVPGFMPGEHYGDYVILDIEIDTGKIANWRVPKPGEIEEFAKGEEE